MKKKFFTSEEEKQILDKTEPSDKLRWILNKIHSCLTAGNTRGFYIMLTKMEKNGNEAMQTLANHIRRRLTDIDINGDDGHIQNSESKAGLLLVLF